MRSVFVEKGHNAIQVAQKLTQLLVLKHTQTRARATLTSQNNKKKGGNTIAITESARNVALACETLEMHGRE